MYAVTEKSDLSKSRYCRLLRFFQFASNFRNRFLIDREERERDRYSQPSLHFDVRISRCPIPKRPSIEKRETRRMINDRECPTKLLEYDVASLSPRDEDDRGKGKEEEADDRQIRWEKRRKFVANLLYQIVYHSA